MARLVSSILGVAVLVVVALAAVWLLGQLLTFLGLFLSGLAVVLWRLGWFLLLAFLLGGVAYFLASTYRKPG